MSTSSAQNQTPKMWHVVFESKNKKFLEELLNTTSLHMFPVYGLGGSNSELIFI
jgi:hypothetical protein